MTNYLATLLAASALCAAACSAAETPATARPAAAKPTAAPRVVAAPAGTGMTDTTRYVQAANSGSLTFTFMQAGASNTGAFRQFATELRYDEKNLAGSSLKVTVQIASLATQDKDRDDTLKSADLFDAQKFPSAQYVANSLAKSANGGIEAVGKLTLRGVTHDLRLPLAIRPTANGLEISGETSIKRLDYGVGQGEWKSTETVGDVVKLQYKVPLVRSN
jgi:polyisoprenoid-binding protein YceI